MKQLAFKQQYAKDLANEVDSNLEKYRMDEFPYDKSQVVPMEFDIPDDLPEKLLEELMKYSNPSISSREEVKAAIALYEAYKDLTPLQASYSPFWQYLSHVTLFKYMQTRWPKVKEAEFVEGEDQDEEDAKEIKSLADYIRSHWFYKNTVIRNQLEGLYWLVRCSVQKDENGNLDYTYTKFLFSRKKLGNRGIGASYLFKMPTVVRGMLKFYMDNENDLFTPHFEEKTDYCIQLMNNQGAVSEISMWSEEDIYRYLDSHRSDIKKIIDRKVQKKLDQQAQSGVVQQELLFDFN